MKPGVKRALKIAAIVLVLLIAIPGAAIGLTFAGTSDIQDGRELAGVARVVKDGYVMLSVLDLGGGKLALVDAGNDGDGKAVLAELARRGASKEAVEAILLTHGHPDHTAACHLFPNAKVYALAAEVPLVEGKVAAHGPLPRLAGARPTGIKVERGLADGETLTLGARTVRVFAVPGHTAGSAAYLVDGVLFVGDSGNGGTDGKLHPAPWLFSDDRTQNMASMRALGEKLKSEGASVKLIVPSHSAALEGLDPLLAIQ
jgi:glyoxylase-like metal-dependent hydrolase (beta-lactamase superfamily II)